jgi:hypothetical protein
MFYSKLPQAVRLQVQRQLQSKVLANCELLVELPAAARHKLLVRVNFL